MTTLDCSAAAVNANPPLAETSDKSREKNSGLTRGTLLTTIV
jgi:hypothetical protein